MQAVVYLDLDGNKVESSYTASNDFMEMYLADEPNGAAIMVYPGGAYAWKSMDYEGRYFAEFYNRYGISVFVVSYALPYGQCTVPLKSVERGMRGIKAHAEQYHIDPAHRPVVTWPLHTLHTSVSIPVLHFKFCCIPLLLWMQRLHMPSLVPIL